jgi:hypothetical protein
VNALDYPIEHFEQMFRLAIALKDSSAQIVEHLYHYHAFGSWCTIVRHRERLLRIVFEGRDYEYVLQESATRKQPYQWDGLLWRHRVSAGEELPVADLTAAIERR